jgi:hypothetical protein
MNAGPKCRHRHFGPYAERLVMPSVEVKDWACQLVLK